jgi:hypothetical protein
MKNDKTNTAFAWHFRGKDSAALTIYMRDRVQKFSKLPVRQWTNRAIFAVQFYV